MTTMTKKCTKCGETKSTSQFSKCSARKDRLQYQCRDCNRKSNLKFRTQKPEHHADWQRNNLQRVCDLVKRYRKADKAGKIYSIQNPDGFVYIGMTETPINVRMLEHRAAYRKDRGRIPLLYDSFDKFGYKNHKIEVILELEGIDRQQLHFIESSFIQAFKQIGKSLNIKI
jgi:hypothetical protein